MARRLRPRIHGGIYHVMNRGNRKAPIFEDDRDRKRFTWLLIEAAEEYGVEIYCGTQMWTHFHLVVLTPHANISEFMQQFEGRFARYINWRYNRVGHLFQGPFKSVVVEDDVHLFTALRYVFANPCESGLCKRFEDWPWSTYGATAGLRPVPEYLSIGWLRALFPADSLEHSQQLFRRCMEDRDPIAAYLQTVDPTSEAAIRSYVSAQIRNLQQPCSIRALTRPALEQLFPLEQDRADRDDAIRAAKIIHGYTLEEISKVVRLHPASLSRIKNGPSRIGESRT